MNHREVVFYKLSSGHSPIEEFLDQLAAKEAQKVTWVLKLVEELPVVPSKYLKKLPGTKDIWEVRVKIGAKEIRLLGFFHGNYSLVLLHAFMKKTMKIPRHSIRLAEQRKGEYLSRSKS
jgi:phage-related protein